MMKPCSDGVSIDVRPSKRVSLDLPSLRETLSAEISNSSISIFYLKGEKVTLYKSGRMLIETRDMKLAEAIVDEIVKLFP